MEIVNGNSREYVTILGIKITSTPRIEVLRQIRKRLMFFSKNNTRLQSNLDKIASKIPLLLVTPNPEQLMRSQTDIEFSRIINSADFALPDALGIIQAAKYVNLKSPHLAVLGLPVLVIQGLAVGLATFFNRRWLESSLKVIKGRMFFMDLIRMANEHKWRVFLLGGMNSVAKDAALVLQKKFKNIRWEYADGPMLNENGKPAVENSTAVINSKLEKEVVDAINIFKPHLLFVAFGAPKAEKWMYRLRTELNVGAMMSVGRTYDYIAGRMHTPPNAIARNFEWLWTGLRYPGRLKRILTAFPLFPIKIFLWKLKH